MVELHAPVPEDIKLIAEEYVESLSKRMEFQLEENRLRKELISLMQEKGLERIPVDDDEKWLVLDTPESKPKLKVKKREDE